MYVRVLEYIVFKYFVMFMEQPVYRSFNGCQSADRLNHMLGPCQILQSKITSTMIAKGFFQYGDDFKLAVTFEKTILKLALFGNVGCIF